MSRMISCGRERSREVLIEKVVLAVFLEVAVAIA